jgi:hypothetical protein
MRIPPILFGTLVLAIFLGIIFGFQAAGIWSVSGKIDSSGQGVLPSAEDVETIKGWMTLEQISTAYNVPLTDILSQFNLPTDTPASTAIKDLESDEFTVTNLRTWLESRMQPPLLEETALATPSRNTGCSASKTLVVHDHQHVTPIKPLPPDTFRITRWGVQRDHSTDHWWRTSVAV